jgi:hypothetical protein
VSGKRSTGEPRRFAYWSGYQPAKRNQDGTLTPLSSEELVDLAREYRREADRLRRRGDVAAAERVQQAADDFQRRAASQG